tara:strand:- start:4821 stop:6035 length:1215 start_codon:yes stop_codon:yes gene_type:complete
MNNKIIFLLIPLSLIFDILTETVFEKGGFFPLLRAVFYYSIILYSIFHGFNSKKNINGVFVAFFLYVFLQIPFSTHPIESLRISLKVLMSILMFPIGYYFINNINKINVLNKSVVLTMFIYLINYLISQYFGIGEDVYTENKNFVVGNLSDSWNNITYMLLVLPVILLTVKKKIVVLILAGILGVLLIISLKRIAILGVFIGFIIYTIRTGKVFKSFIISIVMISIFYLLLPLFESVIIERFDARGDKITGDSTAGIIEKEARYLETFAVFDEILSFENPTKILFGLQPFHSVGNYGNGYFGDRQLHVDYNLIVNTIGLVGLLLYFRVFYIIYREKRRIKKYILKTKFNKQLETVFYMLFITQFITSFGGQMYAFTFRGIIFLYLGAILSILNNQINLKAVNRK